MITTMIVARTCKRFLYTTIIPRRDAFSATIHNCARYYFVTLPQHANAAFLLFLSVPL